MANERQRGAIGIELDRPRTLFFPLAATERLVDRYGVNFTNELYSATRVDGKLNLQLKSLRVLAFFLWAGLQWELAEGEELTLAQVEGEIFPYKVADLFTRLTMALTGAHDTPRLPPGKVPAASKAASPQRRKTSTSTRSSASPSGDSAGT